MTKLENYTLNILTSFYLLFKLTFFKLIEIFSKKIMEVSFNFLNNIFEFAEKKFPSPLVIIINLFCKFFAAFLRLIKLILELPLILFSLVYELIFYLIKSLFRLYDAIVFIIIWTVRLPFTIFNLLKKWFSWFFELPKVIFFHLKKIMEFCFSIFTFFVQFFKSVFLFILQIRNFKFSDLKKLKNINKSSINASFRWFFKVKLGFNEHFRAQCHSFLIKHEKLVKYILTLFFFRVTQIDFLTNGFLED